jgi:hypothetical protein
MAASHKEKLSPKYRIIVQDIEHELAAGARLRYKRRGRLNICSIC